MDEEIGALPLWKSHKTVRAAKIVKIEDPPGVVALLFLACEGAEPVHVTDAWVRKHGPQEGGYYVRYEDGYASFSPAAVFEAGYDRI